MAVEEQFYLLFPLIFFLWVKNGRNTKLPGSISRLILPALLLISLGYSSYETSTAPDRAFYLLPSRFWELASGALLFMLHQRGRMLPKAEFSANFTLIIGLTFIALGFYLSDASAFPFPWSIPAVIGSALVISGVAVGANNNSLGKLLNNQPTTYIGKISYSLYLWHWPVFVLFRWTTGLERPLWSIFALAITTLLAIASFHCVEKRLSKNALFREKSQWYILSRGFLTIGGCIIVSAIIFKAQPNLSFSATRDTQTWYPRAWPSVEQNGFPKVFAGRRIFLIGDSHTNAYSTMLQLLTEQYGAETRQFSMAGCSIVNLLTPPTSPCSQFVQSALSKIKSLASPGDVVFLASLRMNRLGDQWKIFDDKQVALTRDITNQETQRTLVEEDADHIISEFENLSLIVMMDAPKPIFKSPPFRCSDWFNRDNPVCAGGFVQPRSVLEEQRRSVLVSLQKLKIQHPNLVVWDPFPILCPGNICSAFKGGKPLFFDGDHLSAHGNRLLFPSFVEELEQIWPIIEEVQ